MAKLKMYGSKKKMYEPLRDLSNTVVLASDIPPLGTSVATSQLKTSSGVFITSSHTMAMAPGDKYESTNKIVDGNAFIFPVRKGNEATHIVIGEVTGTDIIIDIKIPTGVLVDNAKDTVYMVHKLGLVIKGSGE